MLLLFAVYVHVHRYRGKRKCAACGVPLLVCRDCQAGNADKAKGLRCPTCIEQNVPVLSKKDRKKLLQQQSDTHDSFNDAAYSTATQHSKSDHSSNGHANGADKHSSKPNSNDSSIENTTTVNSAAVVPADNPGKCTRLFLGNLSFKVEEDSLKEALPGITHIKVPTLHTHNHDCCQGIHAQLATPTAAISRCLQRGEAAVSRAHAV